MKKINFYLAIIFLLFAVGFSKAQSFNFTVTPQTQCYSGNNTVYASITATQPGATSYTWVVIPPLCSPSIAVGSGLSISYNFSCCGVYTILCSAWNGPSQVGTSVQRTVSIVCSSVSITTLPSGPICSGGTKTLIASGGSTYTWSTGSNASAIVVSPSVTTCYTVSSNGSCGFSSAATCVTLSSTPSVTISGPSSVCQNSYVFLTASGASSYTWLPGGQTTPSVYVLPSSSNCYTLIGANVPGCIGSAIKCFSILPSPTISFNGGLTTCNNSPVTVVASGANSYTWTPPVSSSSVAIITPSATPCFTVNGTNSFGCVSATSTCITSQSANISVSGNSVICAGNSTTLTASGASTYTWSTGSNFASIVVSPTVTTCYTVIAMTSGGCYGTKVYCVIVNPKPTITTSAQNVCLGSSDSLYAFGAVTYTWYPYNYNGSYIVITPTAPVTCYTVVGTNSYGCINSTSNCFSVSASPSVAVSGISSICSGSSTTLTASGATSYYWYPGGFTGSSIVVTPTASTCYTVYGYSGSCYSTAVKCVSVSPGSLSVTGNSVICSGGSATLTASGATSYTWSTGSPFASIAVMPTVTTCYTVTGTTSSGCTASKVYCVVVGNTPTITASNGFFCAGLSGTLGASGASSYTFYPFNLSGSTILVTPTVSGCYTVVGSNGPGCTGYAIGCYSVMPSPSVAVAGISSICSGSSATLTASGATTYYWYPGGLSGSSIVVTPSVSACYTVYGYYGSCYGTAVKCVSVSPGSVSISGPNSICAGTSATLTASGATSYTWQPGNLTGSGIVVSPSVSTCYTVFSSGGSGCSGTSVKCLSVSPKPAITTTGNNVCAGSLDSLSAYGALTYTWVPFNLTGSTILITATASTCYTVTGTNVFGCTNSATNCFSVSPAPSITVSGNNSICSGSSATLTASGAGTYYWYPGGFTGSSIVVSPSVSTCFTVYGYNSGCYGTAVKCVSVQPSSVSISGISNLCAGNSTTLTASGSVSYTWIPGNLTGSSIVVTPSASTCYTVIAYNGNGCTSLGVKCVTVSGQPNITISGNNSVCQYNYVTLTASGATNYTWLPGGQTTSSISPSFSASGCYTVIGTTGAGCTGYAVKCVSVSPNPSLTLSGNTNVCAGSSTTLTVSGANSYSWMPSTVTGSVLVTTPSVSTCYSVIGYNSFGCAGVTGVCINVQSAPVITVNGNTNVCSGQSTTLTLGGATTYSWYPAIASGSVIAFTPTATTCFSIIGTNAYGCNGYKGVCVVVSPNPSIVVSGANSYCAGSSTTLSASGASTYTWMPGSLSGANVVVSSSISTCYSVTGSTSAGCKATAVKCVSVLPSPVVTISGNNFICAGQSANYLASGALTYTWNTGSTSPLIVISPSGNSCYTVAGTNAQGCVGMAAKCITVQASPSITISGNTTICRGFSTVLLASGAGTYTWSTGASSPSIAVSPTASTTYSVSGNNGSCAGGAAVSVSVLSNPTVTAVSAHSFICAGQSVTLVAAGAVSYSWSNGSIASGIVVSPSVTTTYTVNGTGTNGCLGAASVTQYVNACTGISQTAANTLQFSVYPNPHNGSFNVALATPGDNTVLEVYNSLGQLILSQKLYSEVTAVNFDEHAKGLYYIKVIQGQTQAYLKTVKQ